MTSKKSIPISTYICCNFCGLSNRGWLCVFVVLLGLTTVSTVSGARTGVYGKDKNIVGILNRAHDFSTYMLDLFNTISGTGIYQRDYRMKYSTRSPYDINDMLHKTKEKMEKVMSEKEEAVRKLKEAAENAMKNYGPYKTDINSWDTSDFNAKKVVITDDIKPLSNETQDEIRETINYLPTESVSGNFQSGKLTPMLNVHNNSIHVPTNIYDKSMRILNGIKWTSSMNNQFVDNRMKDPQLTWQYFCSSDGFFRVYPGMQWPRDADKVDTFDCRVRKWYIQAATSPKNIIILLDTSGSMKGLRLSIAKSTVYTILDTLSDEDYFNVIQFSDEPQYVVDCFNGTLMPATVDNISRMKGMIEDLVAKQYANFEKALVTAFELFEREHRMNHEGELCNKAIMLITDGPPDSYAYVFKEYNWPNKTMRVFTFLIGKEVQDNRQARWMACANKGKFTHISTRADVQENVQKYVKVLSRPLAIRKAPHKVWTPMYLDYVTLQDAIMTEPSRHTQLELDYEDLFWYKGLGFIMSVSMPVYDKRTPEKVGPTEDDPTRNLLGVVGADLRINELLKLIPTYKLGVNAYAFAITNHGYILFHPEFKPFYTEQSQGMLKLVPRTKYNSVELSEVERPADMDTDNNEHPLSNYLQTSQTGQMPVHVVTHIDNMNYVENRENVYKYVEIAGAFRLAFVFPKSYGYDAEIEATQEWTKIKEVYDKVPGSYTKVEYSKWIYCQHPYAQYGYQALVADFEFYMIKNRDHLKYYCGEKEAKHILLDEIITAKYVDVWQGLKPNIYKPPVTDYFKNYGNNCENAKNKAMCMLWTHFKVHGIDIIWVGTKSGVTRYISLNPNNPYIEEKFSQTIKSAYYERTVSLWDQGYTHVFTGPVSTTQKEFEFSNSFVTVSRVEVVSSRTASLPAAVLAFRMNYITFYEKFVNFTFGCNDDFCPYSCNDTELFGCYIIDNNGYVLASNNPDMNGTSLFLGEHDGYLMRAMVDDGIFKQIQITDFQSTCRTRIVSGQDNASNFIINPLQMLSKLFVWFVTEFIVFLSQLSVMTWDGISGVMGIETSVAEEDDEECGHWIPEAYVRYLYCGYVINSRTGERKGASFVTQRRPCELKVTRYNLDLETFKDMTISNFIPSCAQQCSNSAPSYQIRRLDTSNLFFVVHGLNCKCDDDPSLSVSTMSSSSYDNDSIEDDEVEDYDEDSAKNKYIFSMKPTEKTYLENERCQRLRNLSDELKKVDKTRSASTICLDSIYEKDTPCANFGPTSHLRSPLGICTGLLLSLTSLFQRLRIADTSLQ